MKRNISFTINDDFVSLEFLEKFDIQTDLEIIKLIEPILNTELDFKREVIYTLIENLREEILGELNFEFQSLGFEDEKHYILIKEDLSDLEEKIGWCQDHEEECTKIAKNGLDFYNKYLSKEGMYDYFYNLIKNLGKIRKQPVIKKIKGKIE